MIRPENIKRGDMIAVTAVSDGVDDELDKMRFENAKDILEKKGYNVFFTPDVFNVEEMGKSATGKQRAEEFNKLFEQENLSYIVSAKGGNFLNEMMEFVDFEKIAYHPKWFQGYSDNTWLVNTITTKCDIMTIYGNNFGEYGMEKWHRSVDDNLRIMEGEDVIQNSFKKYQENFSERVTGLEGYVEDKDVIVTCSVKGENSVEFSGRLIGGCLDVLAIMHGTQYDNVEQFVDRYKDDGIIWYLESFDFSAENFIIMLWKLKESGWFSNVNGIIFGRPLFFREAFGMNYEETVMYALGSLDVPIIFDADIGHRGPRFTIINGAKAKVVYKDNSISLKYIR